ncbi:MAG: 3-methylornithine--L-lysine ligase PylC [Desulfobacula sp.]|nr:3-methylornithine--L-lysine ligase PylC [Desulfobacula sp.]
MLIAVIGGKLQGVEAVYLAKKAGWKTLVIDKNRAAPAIGLCDRFIKFEFTPEHPIPSQCLEPGYPEIDLILPAIEDMDVLMAAKKWARIKQIPLAFDPDAYTLSSSKQKSDILFKTMGLPTPKSWPDCQFPVVVKPDQASGSQGVEMFRDFKSLFLKFPSRSKLKSFIVQEYMDGPSYSIEVIGSPGKYKALQVTDLKMDDGYDCKRVTAPTQLSPGLIKKFERMAIAIAEKICLTGIMDVEVIRHENKLKLLEIDARLPSQTPMTVYWSTGINMVEKLGSLFLNTRISYSEKKKDCFVIVEHIRVSGSKLDVLGEHIMGKEGPLTLQTGFFGANEAITSFLPGKNQWVSTMIFCGNRKDEVMTRKKESYEKILEFIRGNMNGQGKRM